MQVKVRIHYKLERLKIAQAKSDFILGVRNEGQKTANSTVVKLIHETNILGFYMPGISLSPLLLFCEDFLTLTVRRTIGDKSK